MIDRPDTIKEILASAPPAKPRAGARENALDAALSAFEAAEASSHQGSGELARQRDRQSGLTSFWRRAMHITLPSTRTMMLGSASLAVLMIAMISIQNQPTIERGLGLGTSEITPGSPPIVQQELSDAVGADAIASTQEESVRERSNDLAAAPAPQPTGRPDFNAAPSRSAPTAKQPSPATGSNSAQALGSRAKLKAHMRPDSRLRQTRPARNRGQAVQLDVDANAPAYAEQGRDRFTEIEPNRVNLAAEQPVSTFSIDVDTASYSFMRASLMNGVLPPKDSVRIEELINYFSYDYAPPEAGAAPFATHVDIMPTPWNGATKLIRIGIQGYEIPAARKPKSNLVFLLDTSGSMNSPAKLPLLINSFEMLVTSLDDDDTVSIIVYAGSAGVVLEPTRVAERGKIIAALQRLRANGSTAGGEGIRKAYELAEQNFDPDGINRVILATDGDFNLGISDPAQLQGFVERKRDSGVFLSVLGFGRGNYNDALMQALAQNGNGTASYIDTLNEARKTLVEEASSTLFPIAKDVKIQVEFNPAAVSEYRLIGYETRLLNREDFTNDRIDAGEIGAGHSVTALYEISMAGSASGSIDSLRYQQSQTPSEDTADEYAFLKIRYKEPEANESLLISRPITAGDERDPGTDARFAAAVAAFGQILRGGRHTGQFDLDDVIELANNARGADDFGYRTEFVTLVRAAKTAVALERQR